MAAPRTTKTLHLRHGLTQDVRADEIVHSTTESRAIDRRIARYDLSPSPRWALDAGIFRFRPAGAIT